MSKDKQEDYKLVFHKQKIVRTPVFSLEDNLQQNWNLLKDFIEDASPSFHRIIQEIREVDLDNIPGKIFFPIWKYFNRAKFRPIPFGRFAASSIIGAEFANPEKNIVLDDTLEIHSFTDWDTKDEFLISKKLLVERAEWLIINSTVYPVFKGYRFVTWANSSFTINDLEQFEELSFLIDYCRTKMHKNDVVKKLHDLFKLNYESAINLITQLVELQLLLTEFTPNITGEDFFSRIKLPINILNPTRYIIAERKYLSGMVDEKPLSDLPELISFLNKHLPYHSNSHLDKFKTAFKKKFDRQIVPLSIALDPELGVGYADLELDIESIKNSNFSSVFSEIRSQSPEILKINPLLTFILARSFCGKNVRIEEFTSLTESSTPLLPNTFSVLYRIYNEHAVIQHIGGCTGNSLIGRFTLCGDDFESLGREITTIEQRANPDMVFFDVSYQGEMHVDNINRRKQLYHTELPLFTWSTIENPLCLDDIYVVIEENEIILLSKKMGKRLVPRIPSAYNYSRSDFGLYRFLNDLQFQNLRSDLTLPIKKYIPNQPHYPRITYKSIILSPESWLIPDQIRQKFKKENEEDNIKILSQWLESKMIDFLFEIGDGDQTLIVDPKCKSDLLALYMYCCQHFKAKIYISEALIHSERLVINRIGKPFNAQLLATCYHENRVYNSAIGLKSLSEYKFITDGRKIAPGGTWLYFEIYCHPTRSNCLLNNNIACIIKNFKKIIQKWFFIRFSEDGPHIRLRLKLHDNSSVGPLMISINEIFRQELEIGVVTDIQIKTYSREIERYGKDRIDLMETIFWLDSKYLLRLIGRNYDTDSLYCFTVSMLMQIIQRQLTEHKIRIDFVSSMAETFSKEFGFDRSSYKAINQNLKRLKQNQSGNTTFPSCIDNIQRALKSVLSQCKSDNDKHYLLADFIHMHINRLFPNDQRKHEAILYQYLLTDLKSFQKYSNKQAGPI